MGGRGLGRRGGTLAAIDAEGTCGACSIGGLGQRAGDTSKRSSALPLDGTTSSARAVQATNNTDIAAAAQFHPSWWRHSTRGVRRQFSTLALV